MKISKAAICTILFVGLGQVYNHEYGKAITIWITDLILFFLFGSLLGEFVAIPLFLVYFYSLYDALKNDKEYHKSKGKKK